MNKPDRLRALLLCEGNPCALGHVPHTFVRVDRWPYWSRFLFRCDGCGVERVYGGGEK